MGYQTAALFLMTHWFCLPAACKVFPSSRKHKLNRAVSQAVERALPLLPLPSLWLHCQVLPLADMPLLTCAIKGASPRGLKGPSGVSATATPTTCLSQDTSRHTKYLQTMMGLGSVCRDQQSG